MENEQYYSLLNSLERLGYLTEGVKEAIISKTNLGLPYFQQKLDMSYGQENIHFDLHIRKGAEDGKGYYLGKIDAHYKKEITIDDDVINGVDTGDLDIRMGQIDWHRVIAQTNNPDVASLPRKDQVQHVLNDLWKLSENGNQDGMLIQNLLRHKYMAGTEWDDPDLKKPWALFEKSQTFIHTPYPNMDYSAALCYQMLSGKLDILLASLNLIFQKDAEILLKRAISRNEDHLSLISYKSFRDGILGLSIPLSRDGNQTYHVNDYGAILMPYEAIKHGTFMGIDSSELEQRMKAVDWNAEQDHYQKDPESKDDFQFVPEIEQIVTDLQYDLTTDSRGAHVASQLEAKYWVESPDFSGIMRQEAWDYLHSQIQKIGYFPESISAQTAYNLLCGRAVALTQDTEIQYWRRIDDQTLGTSSAHFNTFSGFNEDQIYDLVKMLPAENINFDHTTQALMAGDLVEVLLNNGEVIQVEAYPEKNTLRLSSLNGDPIYTNLLLTPGLNFLSDTKDIQPEKSEKVASNKFIPSRKKNKKNKGKRF
ncbi:hypothetical protein AB6805_13875 [Chitinophaga sp. RCC_12]|uniref:hypothetical protein n=1 Tax=Chitinophaga sp. RCC_12 TaxID=3239226 RepID=UPI0035267486